MTSAGTQAQFLDLDAQLAAQPFAADVIRTPQGTAAFHIYAGWHRFVSNGISKWWQGAFCGGTTTAYTLPIPEAVQELQAIACASPLMH